MKYIQSTLVLSTALATGLFAQNDNEAVYELEPIVVTGELWQSELQQTSASVSVLDAATLDSNGTQHFEDVIGAIPNLTWTGGTSRPRYLQIRGIGENSQFEGETPDSSVRFLLDDFDLTGIGTVGSLFDVQQVEVLRGPQAGAFGANAAGGVVKLVSNAPTPYWTGQAEAGIGNDKLREMGVAVGGPLLENDPNQLTFRFSINSLNQDGFRENQFLNRDDTNERDELTSHLKVRWQPNENWSFEGGLLYAEANNGYDEFTLNNARTDTFSDEPGRDEQETRGASFKTKYLGLDKVELTYTGQFTDSDSLYSYDSDWGAEQALGSPFYSTYTGYMAVARERDVHSHEFRMDSQDQENALGFIDRWTLGLYFHQLDEKSDINYDESSVAFAYAGNITAASDYETSTLAWFGQAAHHFTQATRLIAGFRIERHDVDFSTQTLNDSLGYIASPLPFKASEKNHLWGGKITLEHDFTTEQTLFASVTRGYKAGGANGGTFSNPGDPHTYDNETLWNYEAGLRSSWMEGKLDSQITLFFLDRKDAQLRDSSGSGGFFHYFTSNQGNAEHYGLESEITWHLNRDWSARGSLGLMETKLSATGNDVSNSPAYNYSARLDYRPREGIFAGIEVLGSDDYFESNSPANREQRNAYTVVNASIGYRWDNWTFTLWSKNLFDEAYEERVFFFNNTDFGPVDSRYEAPAAPRTFGVTANYRW